MADGRPGPIRMDYEASGPYGLGKVDLHYRVNDESAWRVLPDLPLLKTQDPAGPLAQGRGRYEFQTSGVLDDEGAPRAWKAGDKVEFFVKVYADNDRDAPRPAAE